MSLYYNTVTQEYPRHIGDLQLLGWQIGEPLPENWVEVTFINPPSIEDGKVAVEGLPTENNGVWYNSWIVRDLTQEEIDFNNSLAERQKFVHPSEVPNE